MAYARWTIRIVILLIFGSFLHYTLPQQDIVRVVEVVEKRQDFGGWTRIFWSGPDAASTEMPNRDVLFIRTLYPNGEPMVFRNEDTDWGWPPYFKFDTANLQTLAADAISTEENPEWYAIRHYGWRNTLISIYPNALSMKPVAGPDVRLIPWFNIVFLTLLLVALLSIWRLWRNFRAARIDPVFAEIDQTSQAARGRVAGWFERFFGRK